MSAASRRKGIDHERRVARELTDATGVEHVRVLTETRDGNCGDVEPREDALPFVYQCKAGARPDVYGAVREAQAASNDGDRLAVAAIHRTGRGGERLAVLPWEDYLALLAFATERLQRGARIIR